MLKINIKCLIFVTFSLIYLPCFILQNNRPKDGCVWLFSTCNYQGFKREFCHNVKNLRSFRFNDMTSSIKIGRKTKAILYKDINYGGKFLKISKDIRCLSNHHFNRITSSLQILH